MYSTSTLKQWHNLIVWGGDDYLYVGKKQNRIFNNFVIISNFETLYNWTFGRILKTFGIVGKVWLVSKRIWNDYGDSFSLRCILYNLDKKKDYLSAHWITNFCTKRHKHKMERFFLSRFEIQMEASCVASVLRRNQCIRNSCFEKTSEFPLKIYFSSRYPIKSTMVIKQPDNTEGIKWRLKSKI